MTVPGDKFRIFISHKHQDHGLAVKVKNELEGLGTEPAIECFVSGSDIAAGANWRRAIKRNLTRSHLLLILFTKPSYDWDWCLYEAGLFTRFDKQDVRAVVALHDKAGSPPRPLSNLQGVVSTEKRLKEFLRKLCEEPWETTDDWLKGKIRCDDLEEASRREAKTIAAEFKRTVRTPRSDCYYPCHRIVLDLSACKDEDLEKGIPPGASVVISGPERTREHTLYNVFGVTYRDLLRWGDLVDNVTTDEPEWRVQLDSKFRRSTRRKSFGPITAGFHANNPNDERRFYVPEIYKIVFSHGRPVGLTVVLDRELLDSATGTERLALKPKDESVPRRE
ncbi:MAG: toll/interleukin-1 receptor domain-containing protein [bacterium]|nr:toll/interleukin-1 receptor domain-containing protein [bacterium]